MFPYKITFRSHPSSPHFRFPLDNRRASLMHVDKVGHVLTFPQNELRQRNRFDFNGWNRIDNEDASPYRDAGPQRSTERDFIDDLSLGSGRMEEAVSNIGFETEGWSTHHTEVLITLLFAHRNNPWGKEELKQILKRFPFVCWPLFYEMHIPRPLWEYLNILMDNICCDMNRAVENSELSLNDKLVQKKRLKEFALMILYSKNTMMGLFSEDPVYGEV